LQLPRFVVRTSSLLVTLVAFTSCATDRGPAPGNDDSDPSDLGVGDLSDEDTKADGDWGYALECKPLPAVAPLVEPKITLSIDGLTLHLTDAVTGFDKVYPVGPGAQDTNEAEETFGESLSYYPILRTGQQEFVITPQTIQPCKTWWTSETGEKLPVFAGLPFLSFFGNYGIHGPIDGYRAANGGTLRRGYVSHGCFRMAGADISEVYALIKGVARVAVHLQREAEKRPDGSRVDIAKKWIGSQCEANADCNFPNGFCAQNELSGTGFCSARCTTYCSDRAGYPSTFCVDDPAAPGKGMCLPKHVAQNEGCSPYDHFELAPATARRGQPEVVADVCRPGSPGWVGDHCNVDDDCGNGTTCLGATEDAPGICSMACASACADLPGSPTTFCASAPELADGGTCLRRCTRSSNGSECPSDMICGAAPRNGQPGVVRDVCLPRD